MKRFIVLLLTLGSLTISTAILAADTPSAHAVILRSGASFPIAEQNDRAVHLPLIAISYRFAPSPDQGGALLAEVEAGFFGTRADREIAGERAKIYTETVMFMVMPQFRLWGELRIYPLFGAGIIFNIVRDSASSGTYSHAGCTGGIELAYRFYGSFSLHLRTRAIFGLDRDRVFYHLAPDLGVSYCF